MTIACEGEDVELFFDPVDPSRAREICDRCTARRECLAAEASYETGTPKAHRFGVYGGMTPQQRYTLERRGTELRCPCGELRDPIDLRAGELCCARCTVRGEMAPIPDNGDR